MTKRTITALSWVARLPAEVFWHLSALLNGLAVLFEWIGDRLLRICDYPFRGWCDRHGHTFGDWFLGWRWCRYCGWREPMPEDERERRSRHGAA